jgi:HicA toxin of bacterial toxin-antitoxin,
VLATPKPSGRRVACDTVAAAEPALSLSNGSAANLWVAHASRVLAIASSRLRTFRPHLYNRGMSRAEKLFEKLTAARSDANFSFDDLCTLLTKLGYKIRKTKGSHIIFQRGSSFLNLQPSAGGKAKAYQVRQVRQELQKLNLKP